MRLQLKNKRYFKYSLYSGITPIYETDDEGNVIYDEIDGVQVARDTGDTTSSYSEPVTALATFNFTGQSESTVKPYGISVGEYDATIYSMKGQFSFDETTLIWVDADPKYDSDNNVVVSSADYRIVRVMQSQYHTTYLLRKQEVDHR